MDTGDVFDPNCPTRLVLDRIGDKWSVLVLLSLTDGPMRFTALRARIGGVTPKVLTQTLRAMEQDGFITREIFAEVPPRVEYTLTDLGHSLHTPLAAVTQWAEQHLPEILRVRATYA
jgi:DNA-binding HxlR family transcriptional regulator